MGLHQFSVFRVWSYARHLQDGSDRIEKQILYERLCQLGVVYSWRGFNHLLHEGKGMYWSIGLTTRGDGQVEQRIYLRSLERVAARLAKRAQRHNPALVETNRPGVRRVLVDLTGSLQDAEARVYNAWFAQKSNSNQISRATLQALWNRRTSTLREWEKRAKIITEPVYAEFHNSHDPMVPDYAYLCQAKDGSLYASARLPNKYHAVAVNEHHRGGNRRKVRRAANAKLAGVQPAVQMGGGSGRHSLRTGRLYFGDRQTRRDTQLAYKQLDRHLRKHGDLNVRHYLFGVQRHDVTVMLHSQSQDDPKVVQQRDWKAERTPEFLKQRIGYRDWLESAPKNASMNLRLSKKVNGLFG
jgi:hypothetical protein